MRRATPERWPWPKTAFSTDPQVDAALALHVDNQIGAGEVSVAGGPVCAAGDIVNITVRGVGGHAAYPHFAVDSTLVAAHILVALQDIVSREIDPFQSAVVTFGAIDAGTQSNIIPASAELRGTVRSLHSRGAGPGRAPHQGDRDGRRGVYAGRGGCQLPALVPAADQRRARSADIVHAAMIETVGADNVTETEPTFGGEDFAFIAQRVPTCMFRLGIANPERGITYSMHHPRFDIDEDALAVGVRVMSAAALRFLSA